MNDQIIRLYVTAPDGRYLPDIGSRAYGEFFDLPEDVALSLQNTPGFSTESVILPQAEPTIIEAAPRTKSKKES